MDILTSHGQYDRDRGLATDNEVRDAIELDALKSRTPQSGASWREVRWKALLRPRSSLHNIHLNCTYMGL